MSDRICRFCSHTEIQHNPVDNMFHCGYVASFLTSHNVEVFCSCFMFVSDDNLEFLELKVKQKELEKLSI